MPKIKADLHMHSTYSDGLNTVEEMIHSALEKGLKAISITDHNTFKGSKKAIEYVKDKGIELVVLYGNEVRARYSGKLMDILVLCPQVLDDDNYPIDAVKLYEWTRKNNCLYIPAHPYDERRYGCGELIYDLDMDAIEGWNARAPRKVNERAIATAKTLGKPIVSNSDAHEVEMVAAAHNIIEVEELDPYSVIDSILKGKVKIVRGTIPPSIYARYVSKKLVKKTVRHMFFK
ncbi:histidinol phosphatase [Ignicoccus islandicus DSM 13165]|uniref:Histidinol phosphatase n=1 Tax=Ignicoccus islandicus DSM 13165 TaxID=940295 RepID=A0A0U3EA93_9CREN|nr:PHP domain-containing protein [Ignicoccus islandicus]ALU11363.1 histidinol phosphatase [Ignicoccus islandicus DSM 13165]